VSHITKTIRFDIIAQTLMTSVSIYMSYMIQFSQSSHFGHGARSIKMTKCMV